MKADNLSAIQAPLATSPVHPRDKNLLRPLSELGKPKFTSGAHSFLRRTEYISSEAKARAEAHAAKGVPRSPGSKVQRKSTDVNNEDPMNILRHVIKGFDLAYPGDAYSGQDDAKHLKGAQPSSAETEAWNRPTHPRKPDLELLDSYALKPDLDAMPDQGAFIITKFSGAPSTSNNEHDIRMDVGLLNPMERPGEEYDYEFYLPQEQQTAKALKRRFDNISDDDDVSDSQEMKDSKPMFKFQHQRTYDMGRQVNSLEQPYREVALALHDPSLDKRRNTGDTDSRLQKGAYYYPIGMKMQLKPKRNKNLANLGLGKLALEEDIERPDEINLMLRDPDEEEMEKRRGHRDELTVENAGLNGTA